MSAVNKDNYSEILETTTEELEDLQSNMQLYVEKLLVEIDTVLDEYSDEWKYVDDLTADLEPTTQSWVSELNEDTVAEFTDRYNVATDIGDEISEVGKILEKAVDKLRDAKRLLKNI